MGSDTINQTPVGLVANASFLASAVKNQAAVWADVYLKTNLSRPFTILIEPTLRCPMHCKFCNLPTDTTYPKETELSLEQWQRILCEVRNSSRLIRDIFISGGEPFLRPDICDLLDFVHQLGLGTRLITIGIFCNQAVCDRLLRSPVKWLKFSLHSARPDVHDALVGGKAYERAVHAIDYLVSHQYGGKIGILTTVWEGNVRELDDLALLAKQLQVDSIFYRPLFGNTTAVRHFGESAPVNPECIITDPNSVASAMESLKQLKRQGYPIANTDQQLDLITAQAKGTNQGVPGCHMMYESIYIRPNGDVETCGHMSLGTIGNVAEHTLRDVLTSAAAYQIRHQAARQCQCQGNAFVMKTLREKVEIVIDILGGR